MVEIAFFPGHSATNAIKEELAAKDGMPPRNVELAYEMTVERLSRDGRVLADLRDGHTVNRLVDGMKDSHFRFDLRRVEDVNFLRQVEYHGARIPPHS